jgi:hypothetical protein
VGWRIEIKSEEEKRVEVATQLSEFKTMEGIDKDIVHRLVEARVQGLEHLLQMTNDEFASIDIDEAAAESLRQAATAALPKVVVRETPPEAVPEPGHDVPPPPAGDPA